MNFQNNRFEVFIATKEDGDAINNIFDSGDFEGSICVRFSRKPNPYISFENDGDKVAVNLLRDRQSGIIVAVGCCIIRKAYVNGEIKKVGYLTGLKILPEYQKEVLCIRQCYEFLFQCTKDDVDLYYTTILQDNLSAQRLLEKKRRNMPAYIYQGDYTVYCIKTGSGKAKVKIEKGTYKEINEFYSNNMKKNNLSMVDINLYGLSNDDFYIMRNTEGDIIAACAIWNQQEYKQYEVTGYNGIFKLLSKLPTALLGYPSFPKEKTNINYASVALLCVKENNTSLAKSLIKEVASHSKNYDVLMLGLYENDTMNIVFDDIKHIKYMSRIYTVDFGNGVRLENSNIHLEVGLL